MIHWGSRGALDIRQLGPKTVDALLDARLVTNVADLYDLKKPDLEALPLFADQKATALIDSIAASKQQQVDRVLFALGIRHVGREVARAICGAIDNLRELVDIDRERLTAIDGVGEEIAESIAQFFAEPRNRALLDALAERGLTMATERHRDAANDSPIAGLRIVFTGTLTRLTRDEAKELAVRLGAKPVSSVSKRTDLVVAGPGAGTKADKAAKLGIEIIDEATFFERLGDDPGETAKQGDRSPPQ